MNLSRAGFQRTVAAVFTLTVWAAPALAVQYPVLSAGYTQEIFAAPTVGAGMAWTVNNNLLSRVNNTIWEYSLTQNTTLNSTNLHGIIATHVIPNLGNGVGMTNGLDGYIYANTSAGLQRIDPNNWAAPAVTLTGVTGNYGITTMPNGKIAYTDSAASSNVYLYDPSSTTNTLIYTQVGGLVDGMVSGPTGNLAITDWTNQKIRILTGTGSLVNTINTTHYPDGMAFSATPSTNTLYSNNNDGTISRYVLGPGYTGIPTITDIATGAGSYGDLASVGPDCAFYVFNGENGSLHGATPGVGTNWDDNTTTNQPSITRIAGVTIPTNGGLGVEYCEFYSPIGHPLPEPSTFVLGGIGVAGLLLARRHRKRSDLTLCVPFANHTRNSASAQRN